MKRINLWSGPRNVSTALMYSFRRRSDTKVVDEPFYAHYLEKSGVQHPGRDEIVQSQPSDARLVLDNLLADEWNADLLFIKNMAHHITGMDSRLDLLLEEFDHLFLIRDPRDMLPSLAGVLPDPQLEDTAYKREYELFEMVRERSQPLHVIDARELLKNPRGVLSELCRRLGIAFDKKMLSWEKGPVPEDGVWAEHWYGKVHESTGFRPYEPKEEPLPEPLKPLYEQCEPYYRELFAHAIKT